VGASGLAVEGLAAALFFRTCGLGAGDFAWSAF
jgi:hypothetical protein